MTKRFIVLFFIATIYAIANTASATTIVRMPATIWNHCKNGEDSLQTLASFHNTYANKDITIIYPEKQTIYLTVTNNCQTIRLSKQTDFNGCNIIVRNNCRKNHFLFSLSITQDKAKEIDVKKQDIDNGDFSNYKPLATGKKMLLIEDDTPWVSRRKGYDYGAQRQDILFVQDSKAAGKTTTLYNTPYTSPKCKFLTVDDEEKTIGNLIFTRTPNSTEITNLVVVSRQYNITIYNITIYTPKKNNFTPEEGDQAFYIAHTENVQMRNIVIQNTYSSHNKYGYAINMDNVRNCTIRRLKAEAQWGIFGNNNINNITLEDCDINRFDIHCYGRDITFRNCTFRNTLNDINTYNQFSSVFGTILFENCRFLHFYPVLHDSSYNAYTEYNLVMRNCYMELDRSHNCIISAGKLENEINSRPELKEKCWPNITIDRLTLKTNGITDFYLFKPMGGNNYSKKLEHLSDISIRNVSLIPSGTILQFHESPFKVRTKQRLKRAYSFPSNIRLQKRIK